MLTVTKRCISRARRLRGAAWAYDHDSSDQRSGQYSRGHCKTELNRPVINAGCCLCAHSSFEGLYSRDKSVAPWWNIGRSVAVAVFTISQKCTPSQYGSEAQSKVRRSVLPLLHSPAATH